MWPLIVANNTQIHYSRAKSQTILKNKSALIMSFAHMRDLTTVRVLLEIVSDKHQQHSYLNIKTRFSERE